MQHEPGQLVEIRRRHFVVLDVRRSELPTEPLDPRANGHQHRVLLSSLEDDALGEELQVVWELEPGAKTYEKFDLPQPTGFDEPHRLDAFIDAVRWGAVSSADDRQIQSPFRSGIDLEDYQLDPVVRALQMPRVNLLIADDVGLGKTIETGLVAQEMILRHRVRTILVVCPASIQIQWRDQMWDKFGLEFRIIDSAFMAELRRRRGIHVNPWTHFPRLITSIDYLKRERPLRLFRETLPAEDEPAFPRKFDLLIVDEAHNVAPAGRGKYATDSQRTTAIRMLTPHFEHKLFLTATPHNGYAESFTALLELVDDQRFARGVIPDEKQKELVVVRRMKSELERRWDGTRRFAERKIVPLEVAYTDTERQAHATLRRYAELRNQGARDASEKFATEFLMLLLKKRMFSSPAAFQTTLAQHERSLQSARKRGAAHVRPTGSVLRRQIEGAQEEYADDEAYEAANEEATDSASRLFRNLSAEESNLFHELAQWAQKAAARPDAKAARLIELLNETLRPNGKWNDERVLIFTEYRTTQKWLHELLAAEKFTRDGRLEVLHGNMDRAKFEAIKQAFQAKPSDSRIRILLATDCAAEGIDLQNYCHRVINYEIPWNPVRMEQRAGRVDRHGQKASEVLVYHFVGEGYDQQSIDPTLAPGDLAGDLEFLMRAAIKVENIREDLGKVGPVIAEQVEEAMLGCRQRLDTDQAERDADPVRRQLTFERNLREQVEQLVKQYNETKRDLGFTPDNIRTVVEVGLQVADQPPLEDAMLEGVWPDPSGRIKKCPVFELPPLKGSWEQCAVGIAHPHTGDRRPITFDPSVSYGRDDVVLAHLNHRLVQMCLRILRAEIWSQAGGTGKLHRVAARLVPNTALQTPAVIGFGRLVVLGGDNQRLHEEVITAGGILREGRFRRFDRIADLQVALDARMPDEAPQAVKDRLAALWPDISDSVGQALDARVRERTKTLESRMESRAEKEAGNIKAILEELAASIRRELREPEFIQLDLLNQEERDQYERNKSALQRRLDSIPAEIERETQAIRDRYANPTPRLFPFAVMFLVPERIAREASR